MKKAITFLFFIHVCIAFVNAQLAITCNDPFEPNNSVDEAYPLNAKINYFGYICDQQDVDWFIINIPQNTHSARVLMSDCPRDYDMEIYDKDLHFVSGSYNKLSSSEKVTINSPTPGKYYVKIFGYQKDHDENMTYALRYYITPFPVIAYNNPVLRVQEAKSESDLNIFPNPAVDNFKLNYSSITEGVITINIYDHVGRLMNTLSEIHIEGFNSHTFDVSYLPNGFYMVEVIRNNERLLKKLTINKR